MVRKASAARGAGLEAQLPIVLIQLVLNAWYCFGEVTMAIHSGFGAAHAFRCWAAISICSITSAGGALRKPGFR